ncbi:MAG: ribokinase [Schaedlerella sp.]|nr:ribokinase [Schaedlerella sp.]
MSSKVTVFGSFVVDLMARTPHLPAPAETVKGSLFKMGAGGKGFNQCVAAHKAGADVTMVTKMGKDSFANVALDVMDELGMPKDHIFFNEEDATGIALILVDEGTSQNEIVIVPGACATITKEDTDSIEELIKSSEYVLMQLEVNQDANERVADIAYKNGVKVILNTAPYSPVTDEFLSKVYMVTPNEVEAEEMTGIKIDGLEAAKKAAEVFRSKGVEKVLITLGSRGVFISADGREEIVPCFRVEALDTTGAGDAFNGAFLTALAEGKDEWEAARFANALAAISVTRLGTTPAMPTREEVEAFLKEH